MLPIEDVLVKILNQRLAGAFGEGEAVGLGLAVADGLGVPVCLGGVAVAVTAVGVRTEVALAPGLAWPLVVVGPYGGAVVGHGMEVEVGTGGTVATATVATVMAGGSVGCEVQASDRGKISKVSAMVSQGIKAPGLGR